MSFQSTAQDLVLRRSRAVATMERLKQQMQTAARREREAFEAEEEEEEEGQVLPLCPNAIPIF